MTAGRQHQIFTQTLSAELGEVTDQILAVELGQD